MYNIITRTPATRAATTRHAQLGARNLGSTTCQLGARNSSAHAHHAFGTGTRSLTSLFKIAKVQSNFSNYDTISVHLHAISVQRAPIHL